MKQTLVSFLLILLSSAGADALPRHRGETLIPVLVVAGEASGPQAGGQSRALILSEELRESGRFAVMTVAASSFAAELNSGSGGPGRAFRVVLIDADGISFTVLQQTQLRQFVASGGGLVVVHGDEELAASSSSLTASALGSANPGATGVAQPVAIRPGGHPIVQGLPDLWMHAPDEVRTTSVALDKYSTVLATFPSPASGHPGAGPEQVALAVANVGKGRIFSTMMGGDIFGMSCVGFITTLQRGTEWAATGNVTQNAPSDFPTSSSVSYRVAIAQMDPAFSARTEEHSFDHVADAALDAMRSRAGELNVGGVAVVAYFEGDRIQSWQSKMVVVGRLKDDPSANNAGSNLLAIAYAKASEMADTLRDSGSHVRPPMTGEFGWTGGVIVRGQHGFLIAAFSGGKSEDDVQVSRAGVAQLQHGL